MSSSSSSSRRRRGPESREDGAASSSSSSSSAAGVRRTSRAAGRKLGLPNLLFDVARFTSDEEGRGLALGKKREDDEDEDFEDGNMEGGGTTGRLDRAAVETYLDDNDAFLEDYVRRKVHRSKLERWLFMPDAASASSAVGRSSFSSSSASGGIARNKSDLSASSAFGSAAASGQIRRQRSRSFTPLRKLSATKFEESGLSTPIMVTDVDGQPTFLRTSPKTSTESAASAASRSASFSSSSPPAANASSTSSASSSCKDRSQSLFQLVEDLFKEKDAAGVAVKAAQGLQSMLPACQQASALLTYPDHPFTGDLHVLGDLGNYSVRKCASASRVVAGVMISGQQVSRVASASGDEEEPAESGSAVVATVTSPLSSGGQAVGALQAAATAVGLGFTAEDERVVAAVARFAGAAMSSAAERKETRLELARSEVFLELAQTVFSEQGRIEPTIRSILSNFLTMIECERCQILLVVDQADADKSAVSFGRVFDLQRSDLDEEGNISGPEEETSAGSAAFAFEGRFPIHASITGEVAATGRKVNIRDVQTDERFDSAAVNADSGGLTHRTMLCMPIRGGDDRDVLGVISLINKEVPGGGGDGNSSDAFFTENDERFVEAFAVFCGMAIRNAAEFERAVVSEARLSVAFDVMNHQASAAEEDAAALASADVPSAAALGVRELDFSYLGMADADTYKATIRMFTDLGLLSHFRVDYSSFCRWILTVKRNYRNETVPYHNWYHGFNVAQMMFSFLAKTGWDKEFTKVECFGLLIACLSHDLDHRGTTNSFQVKSKNALATLYASSTLERHHLNQCLLLLNIPGNRILENLTEDDYSSVLGVIERSILATDLAVHFKHLPQIKDLTSRCGKSRPGPDGIINRVDLNVVSDRTTLQAVMMTAADLGAVTKPWDVHYHVSQLIFEEFWAQGDLERSRFGEDPPPMMDRAASHSAVQLDFIDGVCADVYGACAAASDALAPLRDGLDRNRARWEAKDRGEDDEEDEDAEAGAVAAKAKQNARNL